MSKLFRNPVVLIVLALALLVAVLAIARLLDSRNHVTPPAKPTGSTQSTATVPSSQIPPTSTAVKDTEDLIEGSMGLGDNPFDD